MSIYQITNFFPALRKRGTILSIQNRHFSKMLSIYVITISKNNTGKNNVLNRPLPRCPQPTINRSNRYMVLLFLTAILQNLGGTCLFPQLIQTAF